MKTIKCLIVDDEPLALDILQSYVNSLEYLEVVQCCNNAIDALNAIQRYKPDLVFLDIQMPRLTGIDLIKTLPYSPKIILTTAYKDYALDGYELNVLDYLLKPISFDRFLMAVNKLQLPQAEERNNNFVINTSNNAFIYLKAEKKMQKVFLKDILYIESLKDYVKVKTTDKSITTYQTITYLEEKLPDDKFIRIHRSYIIALDKIQSFTAAQVEISGEEIPIGRLYKNEVMKALDAEIN